VEVALDEDRMRLSSRPGGAPPITVRVRDQQVELAPGGRQEVLLHRPP
jgi:hypothetical protein